MLFAWCARSFLGELGDKTFLLAAVFAVWCPYEGVRAGENSLFQQLLVFLAALSALWSRNVMFLLSGEPAFWDGYFEGVSCILLLLMIPKAYYDFCESDLQEQKRRELMAAAAKRAAKMPKSLEGPLGMYGVPHAAESEGQEDPSYGSIAPVVSAGGVFSEKLSEQFTSSILAFVVPAALVFTSEAEDKSAAVWLAAGKPEENFDIICAFLGVVLAVALAVCLGFVLERQISDHRLTFAVLGILSTLSLVSLSQAMLHLNALFIGDGAGGIGSEASLLALLRSRVGNFTAVAM